MTVLPLVSRELRAEARRPWNGWLRMLAGAVVTLLFVWTSLVVGATNGTVLFWQAAGILYYGIWLIVPLLTADCLSREKREGTLGLLFLTTLKAPGIVAAKGTVHLLRALTFVLAAVPVLTIPVLLGGVGGSSVLWLVGCDFGAILLALTAGLVASAFSREWVRSVLLTALLALALMLSHRAMIMNSVAVVAAVPGTTNPRVGLRSMVQLIALPLLLFSLAMLVAQRRLRQTSLDPSLSKRKLWLLQTFCRPVLWKQRFRAWQNRSLDRNPIGWLQQYSWSARLTKWGWCFIVTAFEVRLLSINSWAGIREQQIFLLLWLGAGLAFTAAASFRRERQTGALELILVTPLNVRQIIVGRLKGIWGQFLPATLVFIAAAWSLRGFSGSIGPDPSNLIPLIISTTLSVPVFGLYFSLKYRSFVGAWIMTCVAAAVSSFLVPWLMGAIVRLFQGTFFLSPVILGGVDESMIELILVGQVILGAFFLRALETNLEQRRFALQEQASV